MRNEINVIVNELADLQLELREDRELNKKRFDLFLLEMKKLNEQDQQLSYKLDQAIDRIKELIRRINR